MTEHLSIVVPCLNEEQYIGKLLTSLSKQTFQNFEVIVIDGHSTDNTKGVVERTAAAHPALKGKVRFFLADKKGVAHQRNLGAQHARYKRLLFLDADVQVPPSFLRLTLKEIAKKKLDLATTDFEPISRRVDDKLIYSIGNLYVKMQQFVQPVAMGFCIFSTKRAHQLIGGFDEKLKFREDYDYIARATNENLLFRVLLKGKVYVSIRRLRKEGRLNYYKKAVLPEMYHLLDNNYLPSPEYNFGVFGTDPEADKLDFSEDEKPILPKNPPRKKKK